MWNVVVLAAMLLAGCATELASTPLTTVTETATVAPTDTLAPSPTYTQAQTLSLTATFRPIPTSTLPPFPTPEGGYVHPGVESISPSGKWIAWWIDCREQTNNPYNQCLIFIN